MTHTSRRTFLVFAAATLAAAAPAQSGIFSPFVNRRAEEMIHLRCAHTDAACSVRFDGALTRKDLTLFRRVAKDWRQGAKGNMDPRLLEILAGINRSVGQNGEFLIISGYRTLATNKALNGTATNSMHTQGRALDLRRSDLTARELRDAALSLQMGGVGYYPQPRNRFVHVDTGNFRTW